MLELSEFIKEKRKSAGLSLKNLSKSTGISDTELMKIENGTRRKPGWNNLCKISKALNFHPFEILLTAGYITKEDINPVSKFKGIDDLTEQELKTIQLFIDFIKAQRNSNKKEGCNHDI